MQADGLPVPAGAEVHTPAGAATVALDGPVYLTYAAGYNEATARWPGHHCRFSFQRFDDGDPMPDLGTIVCAAAAP